MAQPAQAAPIVRNVIFIGETGSGKSSVINLIADYNHAVVSPDAMPCTSGFAQYDVPIDGGTYRLWDTPGLNEPSLVNRMLRRRAAVSTRLRKFLRERYLGGELDLLVLCVHGNRVSKAMSNAYKTICRPTYQLAAPVVIAVTHLENQQPTMDAWWQLNERRLGELGFVFDGFVCLTCLSPHHRKWASQQDVRALITARYRQRVRSTSSEREYLSDSSGDCVIC